ncbi:hypothetical protein RchiOBHm_Chr7g0215831 [Rosa chinensis]|uniref:Uncharacterized protein n=1 Tax=Rosa chinensis TaxID=74649 RepID=A0A2P6PBK3_ROSCH|nr:hypothetical protein RchiOBHm_Chr7g0215831 [Rosa chinensis]
MRDGSQSFTSSLEPRLLLKSMTTSLYVKNYNLKIVRTKAVLESNYSGPPKGGCRE